MHLCNDICSCHIMIGTPGRLEELLQKKTEDLNIAKSIKQLVS